MIDFHCHLLPSLDDGAITIDESIAMAKSLSDFGYKIVCCTPHCIKGYYDLTPQKVREATMRLQADLDNAEIHLELRPGMEYMLDECFVDYADDLLPLADTKLILCEAPQQAHPGVVQESLVLILEKGFVPLIAHPERTDYFYRLLTQQVTNDTHEEVQDNNSKLSIQNTKSGFSLSDLWPFKKNNSKLNIQHSKFPSDDNVPQLPEGVLFQANLGSFTGFYGPQVQRKAYELLKLNTYCVLASDLHDNGSASRVLVHDKFSMNPLLEKLAEFDGSTDALFAAQGGGDKEEQGELF